jgi:imidazolonepropionase-like amidohydrolase
MLDLVLRNVHALDESGGFSEPVDVAVREGRILDLGENLALDLPSADFQDTWLMPGVFDCHDHISLSFVDALEGMRTPVTKWALRTAANLRQTLEGGITFVRDAGGADAGMRDSVEAGYVPGPTMQVSVVALCQTGGHFDGFFPGPGFETSVEYVLPDYPGRPSYRVDGVDEMRKRVRELLRAGADWIKLCSTGGVWAPYGDGDSPELTLDEIRTAVYEAGCKNKGVMVHAFGGEGLDTAIEAGVRSIEHGLYLTEEQAQAMVVGGCWFVPTLSAFRDVINMAEASQLPSFAEHKALEVKRRYGNAVAIARDSGVKIAMGTDYFSVSQHGKLEELLLMYEAGLPVEEVLLAATAGGAELCGVGSSHGRIARGYVFDALILDEPPEDLSLFREVGAVTGVFKSGEPVVRHPRLGDLAPDPRGLGETAASAGVF